MTAARPGRVGIATLRQQLAEMEKRVRNMVSDNRQLRTRVQELELELRTARTELQDLQAAKGRRSEIRGRLQRILADLESLRSQDPKETPEAHERQE